MFSTDAKKLGKRDCKCFKAYGSYLITFLLDVKEQHVFRGLCAKGGSMQFWFLIATSEFPL